MQHHVLLFSQLSELLATKQLAIESGPSVAELRSALVRAFPLLSDQVFAVAVNHVIVADQHILHERDEIALLPPFSGG